MRTLILAALALIALAPMAEANGDSVHMSVEMHDFHFTVDGGSEENPTISFEPGKSYEITVTNEGQVAHDLQIDVDGDGTSDFNSDDANDGQDLAPGESVLVTFTVPDDAGGGEYWCDLHPGQMRGTASVSGGDNGAPAPSLVAIVGLLGAAAVLARRR